MDTSSTGTGKGKAIARRGKGVPKAKRQNPRMPKQQEFNFIGRKSCMTTAPLVQTILPSARSSPSRGIARSALAPCTSAKPTAL